MALVVFISVTPRVEPGEALAVLAFLLTEKALTVLATFGGGLAIIRRRRSMRALATPAS
jgi:hypothetical protein